MSYYGLDIAEDAETGEFKLLEINGLNSGTRGFTEIYGDNRVDVEISKKLTEKHGKIRTYDWDELHEEILNRKDLVSKLIIQLCKNKSFSNMLKYSWRVSPNNESSLKHETRVEGPISRKIPREDDFQSLLKSKTGDVVLNMQRDLYFENSVNSFVSQEATNSKFLQYKLLEDVYEENPMGLMTLCGLGLTDEKALKQMIKENDCLVLKPTVGARGYGITFVDSQDFAEKFSQRRSIRHSKENQILNFIKGLKTVAKQDLPIKNDIEIEIEDLVKANDFRFESETAMVQPYIHSQMEIQGKPMFTSTRVVVVNGEFVDAYTRASKFPVVNIGRDAGAFPFKGDKKKLAKTCEEIVEKFELAASRYSKDFKKEIYQNYLDQIGLVNQSAFGDVAIAKLSKKLFDWSAYAWALSRPR